MTPARNDRPIVDRAQLAGMSARAIITAQRSGRLDLLLAGADIRRGHKLTAAQRHAVISNMTDAELAAADAEGLLEPLRSSPQRDALRRMPPEAVRASLLRGDYDELLQNGCL